jgi:glycosyltransferase EpsF
MLNIDKDNIYPIRVAQVIGKWLGGGVESVVMNYYRHIDRNKIQFDFFCDEDSTNIPYEEIEKLGGKVILIPPYQNMFKYHKELKRKLKENNYKIVHSHINTLSVFSLFSAKCAGVPVRIAHSHSTTNSKEKGKNLVKQILRPFAKVFATDYMACSEFAGRWLFGNKTYNEGKVYLLNNAIDLDKFKYDEKIRKIKREELSIKDDTLVIGHIGRFVTQKNHTFLIDIFNEIHKKNNNSILLLAGQGPLEKQIKDKVDLLGLSDSVKFLGQRNDANELYQAFDVLCLPSLYEGLPVVGVEAQAAGLLCFFSDEMTKETKALNSTIFMSLSDSSKVWSNNIIVKYSKTKRKDTKKEMSLKKFNINEEANKLVNRYEKILKEKSS